ncbi:SDR family NAD(P)-dependent oxidoreductase [Sphaerisporangium siamense]|uniref:Short-subunit dehydrogenase n=1 Tax=Sphaerisporangium siamense TaxID=795645 RepID=A0A7W7G8P6_9ACTN|nr:SDR family NAD(P)-dependent oxidoreductase [Sphaerisporangium siamense]MBB4699729.1 short-subunit dehydrogenase [Sphaerisporangium siamense]
MRVAGARVLITGGSSGVGAAVARVMAGAGAKVVVAGRDRERLEAVAAQTGGLAVVSDVTADGELLAGCAGNVDVLVNNAGAGWAGPLVEMAPGRVDELVAVNLAAPIHLTRLLLPRMIEAGRGHVVFVASIAGAVGVGREAVYSAAKAGLIVFAEALRQELRAVPGVGVSVIVPGVVDTPFFLRRGAPYDRRWPPPIPPERVARCVLRAVERGRAESYVPGWLRVPARLRGSLPGLYRGLAGRLG